MVKNKIFPLVFCLCLLFCLCSPAFAAAEDIDISLTTWLFDTNISLFSFYSWSDYLYGSENELYFQLGGGDGDTWIDLVNENGYFQGVTYDQQYIDLYERQDGWSNPSFRTIHFTTATANSYQMDTFVSWLESNAVLLDRYGTPMPLTRIVIDGTSFDFSQPLESSSSLTPDVQLVASSDAVVLSVGNRSKSWIPAADNFVGFSTSPGGSVVYGLDQLFTISPNSSTTSSIQLYPCYSDSPPVTPTYTSSVQVYDRTGAVLRYEFTVSSDAYAPDLVINFGDLGFEIIEHGMPPSSFNLADAGLITDNFLGFSTSKGASVPSFGSGASISLGGYPMNETLKLYLVYDSIFVDPSDADFTTWIITAVGGFFDFHLWPGLSLNNLVLTVISIGLLYAFLKLTV